MCGVCTNGGGGGRIIHRKTRTRVIPRMFPLVQGGREEREERENDDLVIKLFLFTNIYTSQHVDMFFF